MKNPDRMLVDRRLLLAAEKRVSSSVFGLREHCAGNRTNQPPTKEKQEKVRCRFSHNSYN